MSGPETLQAWARLAKFVCATLLPDWLSFFLHLTLQGTDVHAVTVVFRCCGTGVSFRFAVFFSVADITADNISWFLS